MPVHPDLEAVYKKDRAKESLPRIRRIGLILAVLLSIYAVLALFTTKTTSQVVIGFFIAAAIWGGLLALRFTTFGKANTEEFATAAATMIFLALALINHLVYESVSLVVAARLIQYFSTLTVVLLGRPTLRTTSAAQ